MRLLALLVLLAAGGCTTTARMDYNSVNNFKIDCAHKQQQIDFLRSQKPDLTEKLINYSIISSSGGFVNSNLDGTYQDRQAIHNDSYQAVINVKIDQIRQYCQ
jgi:hypothetical protein